MGNRTSAPILQSFSSQISPSNFDLIDCLDHLLSIHRAQLKNNDHNDMKKRDVTQYWVQQLHAHCPPDVIADVVQLVQEIGGFSEGEFMAELELVVLHGTKPLIQEADHKNPLAFSHLRRALFNAACLNPRSTGDFWPVVKILFALARHFTPEDEFLFKRNFYLASAIAQLASQESFTSVKKDTMSLEEPQKALKWLIASLNPHLHNCLSPEVALQVVELIIASEALNTYSVDHALNLLKIQALAFSQLDKSAMAEVLGIVLARIRLLSDGNEPSDWITVEHGILRMAGPDACRFLLKAFPEDHVLLKKTVESLIEHSRFHEAYSLIKLNQDQLSLLDLLPSEALVELPLLPLHYLHISQRQPIDRWISLVHEKRCNWRAAAYAHFFSSVTITANNAWSWETRVSRMSSLLLAIDNLSKCTHSYLDISTEANNIVHVSVDDLRRRYWFLEVSTLALPLEENDDAVRELMGLIGEDTPLGEAFDALMGRGQLWRAHRLLAHYPPSPPSKGSSISDKDNTEENRILTLWRRLWDAVQKLPRTNPNAFDTFVRLNHLGGEEDNFFEQHFALKQVFPKRLFASSQ